ncbi:DUF6355 family natural product biosynthesis protein [Streptomyces sp. CA-288835]|uniref:DUF6355 family natural product biosynthesis protein n=1 Tax=unclassified Streptomyces TaxID=2593676 RepID=UPI002E27D208|nr:DUF6355 family natural product biosynthesis protein [Streptomyces sp. NBC_00286]
MKKKIPLKRVTAAAAAIATAGLLSAGANTAAAATPPGDTSARACGYYETRDTAYYGHCGRGKVIIKIELDWTTDVRYWCVGPGERRLGSTDDIDYAVYVGTC